ncbi:3-dehydroquinate synthase [Beijerinckia indica]|uniref:Multifunctional fusion protein n=1 Tax=Beijerinckia indica subsp. indica (strain ATCC 9039 / DSM 1715 / NCIMB 8712) TaxID=395963 RepID=B2IDF6_BEII9|nr:3-dehydroquinate synthase [Beijerinckia indica]ACB94008.1 Shikimate kinase., 3-dehydroquinate synthase [Beijerinckia indica subsp. indica ATCC 9039]
MSDGVNSISPPQQEYAPDDRRAHSIISSLGSRSLVLVGLMGSGKTSTGRRLAQRLGLPFVDADVEIESAAGMTISEIFARHGEDYFRDGERRVMARLLADGPKILATGGGAFMNEETRSRIAEKGVSIWLKADPDVLWRRVKKRPHRPLLQTREPEKTLHRLMEQRYPIYARADIAVESRDGPHDAVVEDILTALEFFLRFSPNPPLPPPGTLNPSFLGQDSALTELVPVELGARAYEIHIGPDLIARAGSLIAALAPKAACAVITDDNVAREHLPRLEQALAQQGIRYETIKVRPGEGSKSFPVYAEVCDAVIAGKFERQDLILALGGGIVGDLAGFVAATVRRGMRFVQLPTTLLSQVDSSVGGKTGINSPHGKNLVGAFHQPSLVLADTTALETLPKREFRAGYAEVVKYGLINDPDFFFWLDMHWPNVFQGGADRVHAIATSCRAKAAIVKRDELETGERALLNLGHTFGHAFEALTHFDNARLVHGEGVAIGMACAFRFSVKRGHCSPEDAARVDNHLRMVGLPTRIRDIKDFDADATAILAAMYQDKKVERGTLTFILARAIGHCFIEKKIEGEEVKAFLEEELMLS